MQDIANSTIPSPTQAYTIGIVNYGAGNLFSLKAALDRQQIAHGMVNTAAELAQYDRIIIPGVGHAGTAMHKLNQTGMVSAIKALQKPVLGICVGMQLLTSHSEEGDSPLLDIIPVKTKLFDKQLGIKIPHIGWNNVEFRPNNLFKGIVSGTQFYFVHSYFIEYNANFDLASCQYGDRFSAAIGKANFWGVQFHPEKSGEAGELLLKNFATQDKL
jgi:glutamine amidotransferase